MMKTLPDHEHDNHYNPSVRICEIDRSSTPGSCGFHLTRSKWDPYPWISGVDTGSAAEEAGLQAGDCVLEVNGEDVLGQRIGEVAEKVRSRHDKVSLLLWNSGSDSQCHPESLCCGPMPSNLQRLSTCMSAILASLECPVCLDTIPPPAHQCGNGHLICLKCRVKTERCPVCRVRFCRGRSLLADQVFTSLTEAFELKESPEEERPMKLREKLFGFKKKKDPDSTSMSKMSLSPKNKFLSRVLLGKSSSVDNLSSNPVSLTTVPKYLSVDSDINTNLKTKSLSTNEIFRPQSPGLVSRSPSVKSVPRINTGFLHVPSPFDSDRPASYHGSFESLDSRIELDFAEVKRQIENTLYHCPSHAHCSCLMKASEISHHIQEYHDGPLIQYFKSKISLSFPLFLEDTSVISLYTDDNTFFFKTVQQPSRYSTTADTLVWLWIQGDQTEANKYQLVLTLKGHGSQGKNLKFTSDVYSLSSMSWSDICKDNFGVCLSAEYLITNFATELEVGIPIKMDIEVKRMLNT